MKIRRSLLKDVVTVAAYSGEGAYGPVLATAVAVRCHVDNTRRLVRNVDGDEVISSATLFVHPDDAALFPPESTVAIDGRDARVLSVNLKTVRSSASHAEVVCS